METRQDLHTKEKFVPKRITQKFSEAKNRIRYHNLRAQQDRQIRAVIDKPLLKNFRILTNALEGGSNIRLHHEFLRGRGYDFTVMTSHERHNGKLIASIYHYTIEQDSIDTNYYIVKRGDYE